MVLDEKRLGN
jgi:hypothetical protein